VKLGLPGFKGVDVPPAKLEFFADHFAHELTQSGLRVITAGEIKQVIALGKQQQLLGCADDGSNCALELANALGVDGLISASVGKFGTRYQLTVRILSATTGQPLSTYGAQAADDGAVLDELSRAAGRMAPDVLAALRPASARRSTSHAWIPASAGAAAVLGGGILLGVTKSWDSQLLDPNSSLSRDRALSYKNDGPPLQGVGLALVGVGAVALGWAGWMFFSSSGGTTVALAPTGNGFALGGTLP